MGSGGGPGRDGASGASGEGVVAQSSERGASDIWIVWAEVNYDSSTGTHRRTRHARSSASAFYHAADRDH